VWAELPVNSSGMSESCNSKQKPWISGGYIEDEISKTLAWVSQSTLAMHLLIVFRIESPDIPYCTKNIAFFIKWVLDLRLCSPVKLSPSTMDLYSLFAKIFSEDEDPSDFVPTDHDVDGWQPSACMIL